MAFSIFGHFRVGVRTQEPRLATGWPKLWKYITGVSCGGWAVGGVWGRGYGEVVAGEEGIRGQNCLAVWLKLWK